MSRYVRLELEPRGEVLDVEIGTVLRDVLFDRGVEFPCGGEGICGRCRVRVIAGELEVTPEQREILSPEEIGAGWRLACRCRVEGDLSLEIAQWEEDILVEHAGYRFSPDQGIGVAVDVGTTTIVAQLLDRHTGVVLAVECALNPQIAHGSDVMSRVFAASSEVGLGPLRDLVRDMIGEMIDRLLSSAGVGAGDVDRIVLVGNTVMHHLFCGLDVTPLSLAPFQPDRPGLREFTGAEISWSPRDAAVLFLPCIGGFVGSDVLAGIVATDAPNRSGLTAFMDLGTNGEIVVGDGERLCCASTAAGPAFEAARISMGMRAATGAIAKVGVGPGGVECYVLGGGDARGICGSGLVDAVAAGLDLGVIRPDGRLTDGGLEWRFCPPVSLAQNDIRELQLAKAAITAGLRLLLRRFEAAEDDLDTVLLAGAFGNHVNVASAQRIGLFSCSPDRVEPVGNSALLGAKLALFDESKDQERLHATLALVEYVSLAEDPGFEDEFLAAIGFPVK